MKILLLLICAAMLATITIAFFNHKKDKIEDTILFESKVNFLYKIMTYVGYLVFIMIILLFIMMFFRSGEDSIIELSAITWLLIFCSQSIVYPKHMIFTKKGIYYRMRFGGIKKISYTKDLGGYTLTEKGQLRLISKHNEKINVMVIGKLSTEEVKLITPVFDKLNLFEKL